MGACDVTPHGDIEHAIRRPTSIFEAGLMHGALVLSLGLGADTLKYLACLSRPLDL